MEARSTKDKLKLAGGAIIVACAFGIMLPGVLDYVMRIGRLILLVVIALSIALACVWGKNKLFGGRKKSNFGATTGETDSVQPEG